MKITGLTTDFYELTMAQGYFYNKGEYPGVFDMFFRSHPFNGGYSVFAGLDTFLNAVEEFVFTEDDTHYLASTGLFNDDFLDYLARFRFRGDIYAVPEGTVVFPNEPLLRVHGDMIETQLIESLVLNCINFQSLIATKSARVFQASRQGTILEFGLRRAQGPDGAFSATRAAFIGGASATSNTAAGKELGIPAKGTMAHAWVLAFDTELDSFKTYAELYPDSTIFLIDTYDTLRSGIENAICVGKELKKQGKTFGVRLDSGDLLALSRTVRRRLDEAGFSDAQIAASNELDEFTIHRLVEADAPIDVWGVGTHMVTGGRDSSFTGVYKLSAKGRENRPVMKVSEDEEKSTNPGMKQVYRVFNGDGVPLKDIIALSDEDVVPQGNTAVALLEQRMRGGKRTRGPVPLQEIRSKVITDLHRIDPAVRNLTSPATYPVILSEKLDALKRRLIRSQAGGF